MTMSGKNISNLCFYTILIAFGVQYIRPQEIFPFLSMVKPYLLVSVCLIFLLIHIERWNFFQLHHTQVKLILAFVALLCILVPFSNDWKVTLTAIREFIVLLPFILACIAMIKSTHRLRTLVDTIIVTMVFLSIRGIMLHDGMHKGALFNLGNFLTDPNDFSLYINMMIPFAYFMFEYENKSVFWKSFYGFASLLGVVMVAISFSRGGFLGLMGVCGVIYWYSSRKLLMSVIGLISGFVILIIVGPDWLNSMSTSLDTSQDTAQTRLVTWTAAYKIFIDYPWGIGINNLTTLMVDYIPRINDRMAYAGDVAHNTWLTFLAETGLIGFTIVILIMYTNIKQSIVMAKKRFNGTNFEFTSALGKAFIASHVAFIISSIFITVNYYPHFWYLTAVIVATFSVYKRNIRLKTLFGV